MNEADTRAELIEAKLKAAGWGVVPDSRITREYPINAGEIRAGGLRTGKLKADFILVYKNRKLAVVEAKSVKENTSEGVAQAKLYAQKLQLGTTYATNGKTIYEMCLQTNTEGAVDEYLSPDALWHKTFGDRNEWLEKFNSVPFENVYGDTQQRYYQEIAVNKVMEAVAGNKQRILLTLATGTGKTFIAFQIAWKLFKSRWNLQRSGKRTPRILFLADRNILANQAFNAFSPFGEDALVRINPSQIAQRGEVPMNGSVFFTIFQTFMSGAEGKPYFGDYPADFFDFVIVDECHRGGANDESSWREILEYFKPAVQLGLTATPKRADNADTYKYFGNPVYTYSLKDGIQDGFLTPFKVKRIQTTMDEYVYTPDDEVLEGEVEEGKVYTGGDFNKNIVIEARERKIVQLMLENINPNEKTIVFCANQAHAAMVRDLINQESPVKKPDYCVRVTANDGAIGDMHLRHFQENDKTIPTILTTSQKLTTGVDARNVRNVVLMRPVNSMIEFKQIIGRGTRLFEGKHYFTIIDFVNAYHLFNDEAWDGEAICEKCSNNPCICEKTPRKPCSVCQQAPCICPREGGEGGEGGEGQTETKLKIKLSDGKQREIQSMQSTMFYVDGKPISTEEFLKRLFNTLKLPEIFGSEDALRKLWGNPVTRRELLVRLEKEGCAKADLVKLQEMISAEKSDLFDVLEYISYARKPITREDRVKAAETNIYSLLNENQKDFISFVLRNYIQDGVDELDIAKLSTVIKSKYGGIPEAEKALGSVDDISKVFTEFQKYLYLQQVA
jgi:type I restriction enzyme R subunit